jgi:hypothetical protein
MNLRVPITTCRLAVATTVLCCAITDVVAQRATERYIPIGASPGVSGQLSYIGEIVGLDARSRSVTIEEEDDGRHTLRFTDATRVWLDRTPTRQANLEGSYADCELGRRAEIAYREEDPATVAWMKIEVP